MLARPKGNVNEQSRVRLIAPPEREINLSSGQLLLGRNVAGPVSLDLPIFPKGTEHSGFFSVDTHLKNNCTTYLHATSQPTGPQPPAIQLARQLTKIKTQSKEVMTLWYKKRKGTVEATVVQKSTLTRTNKDFKAINSDV